MRLHPCRGVRGSRRGPCAIRAERLPTGVDRTSVTSFALSWQPESELAELGGRRRISRSEGLP